MRKYWQMEIKTRTDFGMHSLMRLDCGWRWGIGMQKRLRSVKGMPRGLS